MQQREKKNFLGVKRKKIWNYFPMENHMETVYLAICRVTVPRARILWGCVPMEYKLLNQNFKKKNENAFGIQQHVFYCLTSRSIPHWIIFLLLCFRNIFTTVLEIDLFLNKNARKQNVHLQLAEELIDNRKVSVRIKHLLPKTLRLLLTHAPAVIPSSYI